MNFSVPVVGTALAALLVVGAAAPQASGTRVSGHELPRPELQRLLDQLVTTGQPGAIGLARDGDETWRGAGGLANLATERPMRAEDRYRIGSVTKTFTATVVLQLVGERKLRLSDSVQRWLPGIIRDGDNITIRHLLQHTSGLFDYLQGPRVAKPWQPRAIPSSISLNSASLGRWVCAIRLFP
jgi:D-alanyl-D-alanine carboxypeptidase